MSPEPVEPKRVKAFAEYFKKYMGVSTIVVAALPIPVALWDWIPVFEPHRKLLMVYTPLLCFLILGYIFFLRHSIARGLYGEYLHVSDMILGRNRGKLYSRNRSAVLSQLPFILILATVGNIFAYHEVYDMALDKIGPYVEEQTIRSVGENSDKETKEKIYLITISEFGTPSAEGEAVEFSTNHIPGSNILILLYLAIFIFAESAFILMALREYLQDLLGITETELITGPSEKKLNKE